MSARLSLLSLFAAFVLAAGPASVARAVDTTETHGDKADKPGEHGEKKGGLSFLQLERYDLGIFTLIVFGLLVIILQQTAWPAIREGLAKREASIQGAKDEAQTLRAEAEGLRAKLQAEYAEAHEKVRAMLDEARRDADKLRADEKEAGAKDAAAERERAKRDIESAKNAAMKELSEQAVELASLMSAKALRRQITTDDHRRLLDESLAELASSKG